MCFCFDQNKKELPSHCILADCGVFNMKNTMFWKRLADTGLGDESTAARHFVESTSN